MLVIKERWKKLLELAEHETDPNKFMTLINQVGVELDIRLQENRPNYSWHTDYRAALHETNVSKFLDRAEKAQEAMVLRRVQLHLRDGQGEEMAALDEALGILRIVKNERLPPIGMLRSHESGAS